MDIQSIKNRFSLVGNNERYHHSLNVAIQVAPTNLSVLITGESGVGKEVFSQIIHQLSPRKHNQFIAINCGAIPEGTIDSELFGHEKGAFTGANEMRKGYFDVVNGGTIFLDEIGEMPIGTQARLLRVLELGEFIKVGSSKTQKTDVRVIAATNVDLISNLERGKFREDLYYRLNTIPIYVPSLRERKEDIPLFFRKFAADFAGKYHTQTVQLTADAVELLVKYRWPGNIRELKNITEQISVLAESKVLNASDLAHFLPAERNQYSQLPMVYNSFTAAEGLNPEDRDLVYKFLYDLKHEVKDLRQVVQHIIAHIKMDIGVNNILDQPPLVDNIMPEKFPKTINVNQPINTINTLNPLVDSPASYDVHAVEESLSLAYVERELIIKALKKHKGRRRDAAKDLGISERTLYRKIDEYNIVS